MLSMGFYMMIGHKNNLVSYQAVDQNIAILTFEYWQIQRNQAIHSNHYHKFI